MKAEKRFKIKGRKIRRILILNWRDPQHPLAGGAEISLMEHAKYWKSKGAEITWFASSFKDARSEEVDSNGIQVIRKGTHYTVHFWAYIFYKVGNLSKYDIVIDCFHFIPFFTPFYMKNTKIIAMIHEVAGRIWYKNMPFLVAFVGYHLEPLFFKPYKRCRFITVSESTKNELEIVGIENDNIDVIHNGVRECKLDKKTKKEKNPTIIFLGRISKDKGIDDALNAFLMIREQIADSRLWVVGKEESQGIFDTLKKKYIQLDGFIKYWGYVDSKRKFNLLRKSWVLIHPSVKEGWGLTVIEAATQGTPTVAYNVEGLRDSIQDKHTGILTEPNASALADAVINIINNEKKLANLSRNTQDYSKQFNWKKSGAQSWRLIQNK